MRSGRSSRLQAAIAPLGDLTAFVKPLQEALRVVQARASVPPIQERVDSCKLFLERAKKRVQRAQEVIDRVCEQKAEVVEGEARLAKLVTEAANKKAPPVVSAGLRVSCKDRCSGLGARCIAFCPLCPYSRRRSRNLDSVWGSPFRRYSANSHLRRPGSCSLVEPTQLQVAKCKRERGSSARSQRLAVWLGKAHRCSPQWDTISQTTTTSDHCQHQAKD